MPKLLPYLTLMAILSFGPAAVGQERLRCGNTLIKAGNTKDQVLAACGEPDSIDGNRWYYDTGPTQLPRIVVFNAAGVVTAIVTAR